MLIGDLLGGVAARAPGRTAIICGERRVSYGELDGQANRIAHGLSSLGLGRGHCVAILSGNVPEYPAVYFGAARSGAILAHLSIRSTDDDIVYMLSKVDAEAIFVETAQLDRMRGLRGRLAKLRRRVVLDADGKALHDDELSLAALVADQPADSPAIAIDEDDPFAVTFTGGTTGFPKAVLVSHRARCGSAIAGAMDFGLDERDIVAATTPLFHTAGLFVWYQTAVAVGATCALLPTWDAAGFTDMVEREQVTAAFLVPTQLNGLVNDDGFDQTRLASLRKVNFAGAPMPRALFRRLLGLFPAIEFTEHYGQSEVGAIAARPHWMAREKIGTVGRPCFGVRLAVLDHEGRVLPPGEVGDVAVKGDQRLIEYRGDPEQTAALLRGDGWVLTGDVGVLDDQGYLTLVDRSKDMIISGAENIYPTEIENALYTHTAVAECAVFGIPDEHWGEVPAVHVVLKSGAHVSAEELIDHCANLVARHKRPRLVEFVDSLPKTSVGKIQKNIIRARYWRDQERAI